MSADLIATTAVLWSIAALVSLFTRRQPVARVLLSSGCLVGVIACLVALPDALGGRSLRVSLASESVTFMLAPAALWLFGFGLVPAGFACWLGTPVGRRPMTWSAGAAFSLLGALGVFGLQDAMSMLIAWEVMGFGGALLLVGEHVEEAEGKPVLFMLALLEVGAVALLFALLLLTHLAGSARFASLELNAVSVTGPYAWTVGLALLIGFGAKLGLMPFYEWFPRAYSTGSGATGAIFSGVVLNAAYFALSRSWNSWLGMANDSAAAFGLGIVAITTGVFSAILAILFAFQQDDWRALLSYSSAENASVAVAMLGVTALFRSGQLNQLAGLAWTVALLHLAGHSLSKGALFLTADGIYASGETYDIVPRGWIKQAGFPFGLGAVFAGMSLASIPPQAGFVSEWYVFQTVFQGFHLSAFTGRLVLVLAGAGLALAAAVSLATIIKLLGLGLLGIGDTDYVRPIPRRWTIAVGALGICILAVAVGAPLWLDALATGARAIFNANSPHAMVAGWLLVPLTDKFAFISPSILIIVMPLLAVLPLTLLWIFARRFPVRRTAVWYGGIRGGRDAETTPLTFSNAMRTFYSFVYQPTMSTEREHEVREYFIKRLVFSHEVTNLFDRRLFQPATHFVVWCAERLRALQSGNLNFYLALIGGLLIVILALTLY